VYLRVAYSFQEMSRTYFRLKTKSNLYDNCALLVCLVFLYKISSITENCHVLNRAELYFSDNCAMSKDILPCGCIFWTLGRLQWTISRHVVFWHEAFSTNMLNSFHTSVFPRPPPKLFLKCSCNHSFLRPTRQLEFPRFSQFFLRRSLHFLCSFGILSVFLNRVDVTANGVVR